MNDTTTTTAAHLARAQAGDSEAFRALTEPHRRELLAHCYRMLGSVQDAEDVLQDTLLAAWQGLDEFAGRASLRTWLYRIATNRCLNARRSAVRRAAQPWRVPGFRPPEPTRVGRVVWLEPFPDMAIGPEAHYETAESISLAFVTALQLLPPRQLATLLLRDVLGFPTKTVADMLDTSGDAVNSALKRARANLRGHEPGIRHRPPPLAGSPAEAALVAKFVHAYTRADLVAFVALLTDDVFLSMPPMPHEYTGRDAVAGFCERLFTAGNVYDLLPTRANGQPAFGLYHRAPGLQRHGTGLIVLTLADDRISALTRFESSMLARCGLPRTLPGPHARGTAPSDRPEAESR